MDVKINHSFNDVTGREFSFKSLNCLKDFIEKEYNYWQGQYEEILKLPTGKQVHGIIQNATQKLRNLNDQLKNLNQIMSSEQLERELRSYFNELNEHWLWSDHAFAGRFVDCHQQYGIKSAQAFINCILYKPMNNDEFDGFFGKMLGYEFRLQGSDINKRSKTEKMALSRLANKLEGSYKKLFDEVESAKTEFREWYEIEAVNKWADWCRSSAEKYDQFLEDSKTEREKLEKYYKEQLKLEDPAKYWAKSAGSLKKQGFFYLFTLLVFVCAGIFTTYLIYDSWASNAKEQILNLNTFHGVVIFATMVAIFGSGIRVLSKLVFSSFHLMRDAQERNTLAMLYMSLFKEEVVNENSRDIVLQALFSRAEIGLIGSNSSPTLPSVSDLLKTPNK